MLDEVDRRDYLLILAAGPTWVTVRELLAEVKILVRQTRPEEQKSQTDPERGSATQPEAKGFRP